jgi:hypothetical protein
MDDMDKLLKLASAVGQLRKDVKELSTKAETITKLEGPQGLKGDKGDKGDPGVSGRDGLDGKDGKDGKDGVDGRDGQDGASIVDAEMDFDGSLKFTLDNGKEISTSPFASQSAGNSSTTLKQIASGPKIFVQATEPVSPAVGDIWFDIS